MSNSISLSKNQSISLKKKDGSSLSKVFMGLSWKAKKGGFFSNLFSSGQDIDLDSSVLCFDKKGSLVDTIWFRQLSGLKGAIEHSGDNRVGGDGKSDDETIQIDLSKIPNNVETLIFTVNSFTGQTFESIESASCRLVDETTKEEKAKIDLSATGKHKGVIMAKVYRSNGGWDIKSIAEIGNGESQTFQQLLPQIKKHL